jgi:carbonic anhydrase/acetyltransferase-like protein (isoleucine patch superfamily)
MAIVLPFGGKTPVIGEGVFLAPNATIIGDVELGDHASVWFGAVLRGDVGRIRVGKRSNVQDNAVLHMTDGLSHTLVGDDVTIGHGAILHGCVVGDRCLVGMGSVLLDNASIGDESVVAAGSLVAPRLVAPARSLVRGSPAKVVREVSEAERGMGLYGAAHYVEKAREYRALLGATPSER